MAHIEGVLRSLNEIILTALSSRSLLAISLLLLAIIMLSSNLASISQVGVKDSKIYSS